MVFNVNISGFRFRESDGKLRRADKLGFLKQRFLNPGVSKIRAGDNPAKSAEFQAMRRPADLRITEITGVSATPDIYIPKIIPVSRKLNVTKGEITIGQFRQFVRDISYELTGYNAEERMGLHATGTKADRPLRYVNYNEASTYARWLSQKTGRNFRLPTEGEWVDAQESVGYELSGRLWEWTSTPYRNFFVVLSANNGVRWRWGASPRNQRTGNDAFRLVEDLSRQFL
jgi:hypothetical protein